MVVPYKRLGIFYSISKFLVWLSKYSSIRLQVQRIENPAISLSPIEIRLFFQIGKFNCKGINLAGYGVKWPFAEIIWSMTV
jgi:hypothetical protein